MVKLVPVPKLPPRPVEEPIHFGQDMLTRWRRKSLQGLNVAAGPTEEGFSFFQVFLLSSFAELSSRGSF